MEEYKKRGERRERRRRRRRRKEEEQEIEEQEREKRRSRRKRREEESTSFPFLFVAANPSTDAKNPSYRCSEPPLSTVAKNPCGPNNKPI